MANKSMYKNELARAAGVSLKVLNRWLEPHRQQLATFAGAIMGVDYNYRHRDPPKEG